MVPVFVFAAKIPRKLTGVLAEVGREVQTNQEEQLAILVVLPERVRAQEMARLNPEGRLVV